MFAFRMAAIVCDLLVLSLSVLTAYFSPGITVPDLPSQLAVLGVASGGCSVLLLTSRVRQSTKVIFLGVAKTLFTCLIFFLAPWKDLWSLLLWTSYIAVLVFHLEAKALLVLAGLFLALTVLILVNFPSFFPPSAAELFDRGLLAASALLLSAILVLVRLQAQQLAQRKAQIGLYEKDLERLTEANVGFQEYSSLIEQHTLRAERDRISREIHDSTGYALTTLKMIFEAAKGLSQRDPAQIPGLMDQGRQLSKVALDEVRAALRELRARQDPVVGGLSFIVRLIRNFESVTKIKIQFEFTNAKQSYSPEVNAFLYKMVQESLTNAYRHSRASWVRMVLSETENRLQISISNDGQASPGSVKGIGLSGMEERIKNLGGSLQFPQRDRGFEILASIPVVKEATHA